MDPHPVNTPTCDADCTEPDCGDGFVNTVLEQCEPGMVVNNHGDSTFCNHDCTVARCGDGYPNSAAGEECDGGNRTDPQPVNTMLCDADCTLRMCGDGFVNTEGEECDPATHPTSDRDIATGDSMLCDHDCTIPVCGDNIWNEAAEFCNTDADCTNSQHECVGCSECKL